MTEKTRQPLRSPLEAMQKHGNLPAWNPLGPGTFSPLPDPAPLPKPVPWGATEGVIYRYLQPRKEPKRRGGYRKALFVVLADQPVTAEQLHAKWGHGRYRIEWRDQRGAILSVQTFCVGLDGQEYEPGRVRRRKLPLPLPLAAIPDRRSRAR
jgi:hypothetical protein